MKTMFLKIHYFKWW